MNETWVIRVLCPLVPRMPTGTYTNNKVSIRIDVDTFDNGPSVFPAYQREATGGMHLLTTGKSVKLTLTIGERTFYTRPQGWLNLPEIPSADQRILFKTTFCLLF